MRDYLYAIVDRLPRDWRGPDAGVGGAPVHTRRLSGLHVVSSSLADVPVAGPRTLALHHDVIESVMAADAVLPVRYGLSLPPGDYCLVEAPKKGKLLFPPNDQYSQWDTACYRKNYEQCDYLLSVKGKTSDVQIVFSRPCPWHVPCRNYSGPLPPMAHPAPQEKPPHQE